jgi:integrase
MRSVCLCGVLHSWPVLAPERLWRRTLPPRMRGHSIGLVGHKRKPHLHGVFDQPIGQWKEACKDACTAAGIRYRWHDLRHTFITVLRNGRRFQSRRS